MDEVYAIIPARAGSKGVPDKNIRLIAGRPLLAYSIIAARRCSLIDRVIVSTDSQRYAEIALEYGAEVPFLRPAEFASDEAGDPEIMNHVLGWFREHGWNEPELLVHLRPTTPFRDPDLIAEAITLLRGEPEATALRSAHEMANTAYKCFEVESGRLKSAIIGSFDLDACNHPRQSYPVTYDCNGYVDILRPDFINKNPGKVHGDRVAAFITPFVGEVDTFAELEYLEYFADRNPLVYERLFAGEDSGVG